MSEPWRTTRVVLETGGWWEVLPDDINHFISHARAYLSSRDTDPEARERVKKVWINREYAPAWRPFRPRPGKVIAPSGAQVEADTGEVIVAADDDAPF